jgi:hypothetical protein
MISELERMWEKVFMGKFKVLSLHLPAGTEENEKPVRIVSLRIDN